MGQHYSFFFQSPSRAQILILQHRLLQRLFYKATIIDYIVLFSDASDIAFGGFSASLDGTVVSGMWEPEDIGQSSTFRELKAIYFVLLSYVAQLKHKRVKI